MTKKKEICRYELLCLLNEKDKNIKKYEKLINSIEKLIGKENVEKIEEKNWKPVYKISKLNEGNYVLIYFASEREKVGELEKDILQSKGFEEFLNRYLLLNLEDEKRNKIKLKEKDAE